MSLNFKESQSLKHKLILLFTIGTVSTVTSKLGGQFKIKGSL